MALPLRWRRRKTTDLRFLGLARKAGRVEIGEEAVRGAAKAGKARLILTAEDSSPNALKRAEESAAIGNVPLVKLHCTKAEMGQAVGKDGPSMLAVTDAGFALGMVKKLAAASPEEYGSLPEELSMRDRKTRRARTFGPGGEKK